MEEKYQHFLDSHSNQEDFCCVPYALMAILDEENLLTADINELKLANMLEFKIPERLKDKFPSAIVTDDTRDQGCHVRDLNKQIFRSLDIPLYEHYKKVEYKYIELYSKKTVMNMVNDFILNSLNHKNHLIIPIHFGTLMDDRPDDINKGRHTSLVVSYNEVNDIIKLFIPSEHGSFYKEFPFELFFDSMQVVDDGIWEISRKE